MGCGIAVVFAYAGHQVSIIDFKARDATAFARLATNALAEVSNTLISLARFGLFDEKQCERLSRRVKILPEAEARPGTFLRGGDLRRRPRGARRQTSRARPRLGACRPTGDHRFHHVDYDGR